MRAVQAGSIGIVQVLLDKGARVNEVTTMNNTALSYAVAGGYKDIAELLRSKGAK
jgi:ankyrin repeat protein